MSETHDIETNRYKIAALLSDCELFEYDIATKIYRRFAGNSIVFHDRDVIENFRYNDAVLDVIYDEDLEKFYEFCNELESGHGTIITELRAKTATKGFQWIKIQGQSTFDEDLCPQTVIGKITNVDARHKEKDKLRERAERDPLTTLYNKETTEKLINKLLKSKNEEKNGAFLLIDFDNFKGINDNLGHLFGDSILRDVSSQLRKYFGSNDIIGRVGGDEFVVYIAGPCDRELTQKKIDEVRKIFDNIYTDKEKQLVTSCSIGVAHAQKHGTSYKELFKKSDIALYQAKNNGKGCWQMYDEQKANQNILESQTFFKHLDLGEEHSGIERHSFSKSIIPFFNLLYFSEDMKNTIQLILSLIGQEYELNRVYVCETSKDKQCLEYAYEWTSQGMEGSRESGPVCVTEYDGFEEIFNEEGVFYCNELGALQFQSEATYEYLSGKRVKSLLWSLILDEGQLKGLVGFEICEYAHTWRKNELDNLITLARMLSSALVGYHKNEQIKEDNFILKEISNNQNLQTYILKANSFEIALLDERTKELYPNAKKGDLCYKVLNNQDIPCDNCPLYGLSKGKTRHTVDSYNKNKSIRLKTTATRIHYEETDAILICSAEVTDLVETIQGKDDLTGLPSLSKFEKEASKLLKKNTQYAIISIDIDKFKNINSILGFQEGNQMLLALVDVISTRLKMGELFCRSYADKFLMMLEYENTNSLASRANRIFNSAINYLQTKYNGLHLVMAGGMYVIDVDECEISEAIDKANIARKSIKGSHKSLLANYDDKIHRLIMQEKQVESRMISALANNEFVVYYQPKVNLRTNQVVGAEALVRWRVGEDNIIPPGEFIPIFEKNGFINQMDFYVYESVFSSMSEWARKGRKMIPISVNLSRAHIGDKEFVHKIKGLVNRFNIPPEMVELEITESVFLSDKAPLIEVINSLKRAGFHLSIDDFGSGYSSLNLLRHLKLDVLKLDKEFFDQDKISPKESIVLANVIRMSKELGMVVLSEGVETREQAEYLATIGCDMAQGYYFAKPMPKDIFEQFVYQV